MEAGEEEERLELDGRVGAEVELLARWVQEARGRRAPSGRRRVGGGILLEQRRQTDRQTTRLRCGGGAAGAREKGTSGDERELAVHVWQAQCGGENRLGGQGPSEEGR